jgi:hypothetical protein
MLGTLDALHRQDDNLATIRRQMAHAYGALAELGRDGERNQAMVDSLTNATRVLANHLIRLRDALDVPYPFEHADASPRLGRVLVPQVPPADELGGVFEMAQHAVTQAFNTRMRSLAHLCRLARQVERVVVPDEPSNPLSENPAPEQAG